ncbi:TetR/AcrR family transcriptional regulator, partial [Streptomyces sp. NPDC059627]
MGGVNTSASTGAVTAERAPKQDRSRATRQRLLEAAVACLAEHGWTGSTVAVVAERAGVSRGAAQHHFPTREDLFTAAVEYVAEERSTALRALFPQGAAAGGPKSAGRPPTGGSPPRRHRNRAPRPRPPHPQ